ncbi:hypothetical protein [Bacteroides helcogenes]|nr:hypothetical protein [Bacteroides helcogenes]MDY5237640.1 hypothetical protein [Bacteroides helcogenes]
MSRADTAIVPVYTDKYMCVEKTDVDKCYLYTPQSTDVISILFFAYSSEM